MADWLGYENAFRRFGIPYDVEPGAYERGHGDMRGFRYVAEHHTAGGNDAGDIRVVRDGRSDLPGPLSQIVLQRNGKPRIIAVGVCYHAPSKVNFMGVGAGQGNWWSIGIEGVSNGRNDWTPEQREMYPRVVAALLVEAGLPLNARRFHRDLQPGEKVDPVGFDNAWFQRMVESAATGGNLKTAIQQKREENPWLGAKTIPEEERPTADGVGRWAGYEFGHIYWHPNLGARVVRGEIFEKYTEVDWERGVLGYPIADTISITGGYAQAFQNGSIYRKSGQPGFVLGGKIGDRWAQLNWETGPLGYPVSDERDFFGGRVQDYEGGTIFWHPNLGDAKEISNPHVREEYARVGHEVLGFPTGVAILGADRRGIVQNFEYGAVYAINGRPTNDGNAITGSIFELYGKLGWESGRLGWPVTDVYVNGGDLRADFEGGSIEYDSDTGVYTMVLSGKRIEVPLADAPTQRYVPELREVKLTPVDGMTGGISHFATPGDASTRGRNMGISGEPADSPWDVWYCAMRFNYVRVQPNPDNPNWVKPVPGTSDLSLKEWLKGRKIMVTNEKNGRKIVVRPADWGPGVPKRVVDVSPTAMDVLGAHTDDPVRCEWVDPQTPLGPVA